MYESAIEAMLDMPTLHPQVLLTDLIMPRVDGFELVKTVNEHISFRNVAVVVMTGLSQDQVLEKGGLPDGVHLLLKPVDLDWLRGFFDALISMRQKNQRLQMQKNAELT